MSKKRTRQQKRKSKPTSNERRSAFTTDNLLNQDLKLIKQDWLKTVIISSLIILGLIAYTIYLN